MDDVEVDTKDNHGHSLLSYATEHVNEAVVKILVAWDDIEVDTKDDHGRSPLSYAAEHGIRRWWRSLSCGTTSRWTPGMRLAVCCYLTPLTRGMRRW